MVCYAPLKAFRSYKFLTTGDTDENGITTKKRKIQFEGSWRFDRKNACDSMLEIYDYLQKEKEVNESLPWYDRIEHLVIPCGQCIGCDLAKARDWTGRICCEQQTSLNGYFIDCDGDNKPLASSSSIFLTLTYNDSYLPYSDTGLPTLRKEDFQKFMKRLRKKIAPKYCRYYACGEYGEKYGRPHYHAIIFGYVPDDLVMFKDEFGHKLYVSESLQRLWPYGFCSIGSVTFDSAMYVAGYVTKKITGDRSEEHYKGRLPEFALMSRRPGIGKTWIEEYYGDVYNHDRLVLDDSHYVNPPRYFDNIYSQNHAKDFRDVKAKREDISMVSCREFFQRENYANVMQQKKDFERLIKNDL